MWLLYLVQTLFSAAFSLGFYLWWVLEHVGHGYPPEQEGFLRWWHGLNGQPEFHLLMAQLLYPLFWWLSRKAPWPVFWRYWRNLHLVLVVLLVLATSLLWLATPDLGGNWG